MQLVALLCSIHYTFARIMDFSSLRSGDTIKQTKYTMTYSDAWVLDGVAYYFSQPYHGVAAARTAVAKGLNISASTYYGPNYEHGVTALLHGSKAGVNMEMPGLFNSITDFFRGLVDSYDTFTGNLMMVPGGCWWYYVEGSSADDINCIGRTANTEVILRSHTSRVPCPVPGFACYKFEPASSLSGTSEGSTWSSSGYKRMAREGGKSCMNFGITWTTGLDCSTSED